MTTQTILTHPDIAAEEKPINPGIIQKVGMEKVHIPILLESQNRTFQTPAFFDLQVNVIDPNVKGIHMSRLYKQALESFGETHFSVTTILECLKELVIGQGNITDTAYLSVSFTYAKPQQSLLSGNTGWRYYPTTYYASYDGKSFDISTEVVYTYSSTCPCSAALSRQLLIKKFDTNFNHETLHKNDIINWLNQEENMGGLPHAQRSTATIKTKYINTDLIPSLDNMINTIENKLKTSVQGFVKRQDEQEFAKMNAENLLFSEDAVRLLRHILEEDEKVSDYSIHVEHFESLHPHNATAKIVKGVTGGFSI